MSIIDRMRPMFTSLIHHELFIKLFMHCFAYADPEFDILSAWDHSCIISEKDAMQFKIYMLFHHDKTLICTNIFMRVNNRQITPLFAQIDSNNQLVDVYWWFNSGAPALHRRGLNNLVKNANTSRSHPDVEALQEWLDRVLDNDFEAQMFQRKTSLQGVRPRQLNKCCVNDCRAFTPIKCLADMSNPRSHLYAIYVCPDHTKQCRKCERSFCPVVCVRYGEDGKFCRQCGLSNY